MLAKAVPLTLLCGRSAEDPSIFEERLRAMLPDDVRSTLPPHLLAPVPAEESEGRKQSVHMPAPLAWPAKGRAHTLTRTAPAMPTLLVRAARSEDGSPPPDAGPAAWDGRGVDDDDDDRPSDAGPAHRRHRAVGVAVGAVPPTPAVTPVPVSYGLLTSASGQRWSARNATPGTSRPPAWDIRVLGARPLMIALMSARFLCWMAAVVVHLPATSGDGKHGSNGSIG